MAKPSLAVGLHVLKALTAGRKVLHAFAEALVPGHSHCKPKDSLDLRGGWMVNVHCSSACLCLHEGMLATHQRRPACIA